MAMVEKPCPSRYWRNGVQKSAWAQAVDCSEPIALAQGDGIRFPCGCFILFLFISSRISVTDSYVIRILLKIFYVLARVPSAPTYRYKPSVKSNCRASRCRLEIKKGVSYIVLLTIYVIPSSERSRGPF